MRDPLTAATLQQLTARAATCLSRFTGQEIANLCLGLAYCNFKDDGLMMNVAQEMALRSPSLHDRAADLDLSTVMYCFAELGMQHGGVMKAIAMRLSPMLHSVNDWALCSLAWSYDKLDRDGCFFDFRGRLQAEVARRSLTASDVERSNKGPEDWWLNACGDAIYI